MHVYYHLSRYISHRKSGLDFVDCLRLLGHTVLLDPAEAAGAQMAIVHDDPLNYPAVLELVPALGKIPWIAYAVWEADILPEAYSRNMALADGVWTCSRYCRASMAPWFPEVQVVPHVVKKRRVPAETLAAMRRRVDELAAGATGPHKTPETANSKPFTFFSLVDSVNPRKNVVTLLAAFAAVRARSGETRPVRLLLKQYRKGLEFQAIPGVVSIDDDLTDEEIAALHLLSDCYVSAHHAEGWGLGLSEAMAYGRPVVATGFSGNMEFMNSENSLPVPYDLAPVTDGMCRASPLFTPAMTWADIRLPDMVESMGKVLNGRHPPDLAVNAATAVRNFSPEKVAEIMAEKLDKFMGTRRGA